jgi:hypothetical protein
MSMPHHNRILLIFAIVAKIMKNWVMKDRTDIDVFVYEHNRILLIFANVAKIMKNWVMKDRKDSDVVVFKYATSQ